MNCCQVRRLVRLHEKAARHMENYNKLSKSPGAPSKALDHLRKAERLHSQISGIMRDINPAQG
jgi:hypothetical protein